MLQLILATIFMSAGLAQAEKINIMDKINTIDCRVVFDEEPGSYKLRVESVSTPVGPQRKVVVYLRYPTFLGSKVRTYEVKGVTYDTESGIYEITQAYEGKNFMAAIYVDGRGRFMSGLDLYKCAIVGNWKRY